MKKTDGNFMRAVFFLVCLSFLTFPYPAFSATELNEILLIDDFNDATTENILGGETQGDEETDGGCVPLFTATPAEASGYFGHSLRLEFDVTFPGTFSFYTTKLGAQGATPYTSQTRDLTEYAYLSFWFRTDMKSPHFAVEVHRDSDGDGQFLLGKDSSSKVSVKNYIREYLPGVWHKVVIPLRDFKELSRWENIVEFVFVFDNALHSGRGVIYYDDILLGSQYPRDEKETELLHRFPYRTQANMIVINGTAVLSATVTHAKNSIDILLHEPHPFLERVSVEVFDQTQKRWNRVLSFFDHTTGMYSGEWLIDAAHEDIRELRVVAMNIMGEEGVISDTIACSFISE
jgi:hypothetical protein